MSKPKVMNGTPVGNEHLCRRCSNGQYTVGYRETDVLVICTNSNPARVIPFVVHECTQFWDRNRPDYDEMTKLALSFSAGHHKATPGFRQSGFERVRVAVEDEREGDNHAEAARAL